jgi:hypothetical protein
MANLYEYDYRQINYGLALSADERDFGGSR